MRRELVLVGEAPGGVDITLRPSLALTGSTGRNLASIAQVNWLDYLRWTDRRNLFLTPQERWDHREARRRADAMTFAHDDVVVLLGAQVAAAFGADFWPLFTWHLRLFNGQMVWVATAPHPSGRNRMLNDQTLRGRFGEFMREAFEVARA